MTETHPTYGLSAATDPEIISHLGRIAASWAALDSIMVELLCRLLRNDPAGEVIYFSVNSFRGRLDIITNIVTELMEESDPRRDGLLQYLRRVNDLNNARNELIHSGMRQREDGSLFRAVRRPGRKVPRQEKPVRASDLEQHGKAVTEVGFLILLLINPQMLCDVTDAALKHGAMKVLSPEIWEEARDHLLRNAHPLRPAAGKEGPSTPPQPAEE